MSHGFVDPRAVPTPPWRGDRRPLAAGPDEVAPLLLSMAKGRLYDVESWIAAGRPIQFAPPADRRRACTTPLEAAIRSGEHDVALLLLCNGYDPALERTCPLTLAIEYRRADIFELALAWGADLKRVESHAAVEVRDVPFLERLWSLGVDLTAHDAIADAVAHDASNRQLYGFLKRRAGEDPKLQNSLNRGLSAAVDRQQGGEKAVSLCVWAGADPWAFVADPRDRAEDEVNEKSWRIYRSALGRAVSSGRAGLLRTLRVSRSDPRFQQLFDIVYDGPTYDALAALEPPRDLDAIAARALGLLAGGLGGDAHHMLQRALAAGGRVRDIQEYTAKSLRRRLTNDGHLYPSPHALIDILQDPTKTSQSVFIRVIACPKLILRARRLGIKRESVERVLASPTCSSSAATAARRELRRWRMS